MTNKESIIKLLHNKKALVYSSGLFMGYYIEADIRIEHERGEIINLYADLSDKNWFPDNFSHDFAKDIEKKEGVTFSIRMYVREQLDKWLKKTSIKIGTVHLHKFQDMGTQFLTDGTLHSVQFISSDGFIKFYKIRPLNESK